MVGVLQKYSRFAKAIETETTNGDLGFLKPATYKSKSSYKKPYSMQQFRGVVIWNHLFPNNSVPPESAVRVAPLDPSIPLAYKVIKVPSDNPHMDDSVEYEEQFDVFTEALLARGVSQSMIDKMLDLFKREEEIRHYGLSVICVPANLTELPDELLKLFDFNKIVTSTLSNGNIVLESLGLVLVKSRQTSVVSNLIRF